MNKKLLTILILLCITLQNVFTQNNSSNLQLPHPFEKEAIKGFAQDLYQNGFWDEAESEFKRYLFLSNQTNEFFLQEDNEIIFKLASIYNITKNLDGSIWLFNNFSDIVKIEVSEKIFLNCASMAFKKRDLSLLSSFNTKLLKNYSPEIQLLFPISISLLNNDFETSKKLITQASLQYSEFSNTKTMCDNYSTKNPYLAMTLSIFIPGSGKWYTNSFSSFISSFLTIGGFTAGTIYTGIKYEWKNWRTYALGSVALIFYIADIYGSYKSAQRYNQTQYRLITESVDSIYETIF